MNALILGLVLTQTPAAPAIPAFTMTRWLNVERPVSLSDYRGKVVILHVNPGFC